MGTPKSPQAPTRSRCHCSGLPYRPHFLQRYGPDRGNVGYMLSNANLWDNPTKFILDGVLNCSRRYTFGLQQSNTPIVFLLYALYATRRLRLMII